MTSPLDILKDFTGGQTAAVLHKVGEENIPRLLRGELKIKFEVVRMILAINRAKPFDPAAFIGANWAIWRGPADADGLKGEERQDARSLALTEVDFTKARFETCLAEGETVITGEQRLTRLLDQKKDCIRADDNIGAALLNEPGQVTLEWLYQTHGVTWFELPGTELRSPNGYRRFLCLCRTDDGRWHWGYDRWLGNDRGAGSPALVFAS